MTENRQKSSILLIYTGGTIGMKLDHSDQTLKPFDFSQILEEVPELGKYAIRIDSYTFNPLIDSSDVEPGLWQSLAGLIGSKYNEYDGFVILHGTDTMSYSASALSFMLEGLGKPVVFTGSQLPIGAPRTDGKENLVSSVEIASAKGQNGHAIVPEVCIFFNSKLMRGNRTTKASSEDFDAFVSGNLPPLAEAGVTIKYNFGYIRYPDDWSSELRVNTNLDTRVSILKVHPGITPQIVKNILLDKGTRAVILETYGSGNAISKDWFIDMVKEADRMGKVLVNVTQCLYGGVNMDLYATGKRLKDAGVVSGHDCTTESALAKLFSLMGKYSDNVRVKAEFVRNLCGENS